MTSQAQWPTVSGMPRRDASRNDLQRHLGRASLGAGRTLIGEAEVTRASAIVQGRADQLEPGLSEEEALLLNQVLAGQTDDQIAQALGRDLLAARRDIAGLIDRLLRS